MAADVSKCRFFPTAHLLDRMRERGITTSEVDEAVYRGSRVWTDGDKKFQAIAGSCVVVVAFRKCHLTGVTTWVA